VYHLFLILHLYSGKRSFSGTRNWYLKGNTIVSQKSGGEAGGIACVATLPASPPDSLQTAHKPYAAKKRKKSAGGEIILLLTVFPHFYPYKPFPQDLHA
jgi:hypothetical protein